MNKKKPTTKTINPHGGKQASVKDIEKIKPNSKPIPTPKKGK